MKPIPDEKQLEEMLAKVVPAQTARLDQRLAGAPWTARGVVRHRLINATVFAVLAALALFVAATPQGHAFAQSMLRFFVRTESDTRPVPTLVAVAATPAASFAAATPGAAQEVSASPFPETHLPFEETCGDLFRPGCGLDEIRSLVTFPVKGLETDAGGLTFVGATGGPQQVVLVYTGKGINGGLTITQEPAGDSSQPPQVAASAEVEAVSINGVAGEYVQGSWYSIGGASDGVSWTADPFVQTLRWEADSVLYTLVFHAGKETGRKLDKAELVSLAGQLTTDVDARATRERLQPMEMVELSAQAGFAVVEPGWLPSKYVFQGATYTSEYNTACLYYSYGAGDLPALAIAERPITGKILDDITINTVDWNGQAITIPAATEPVAVGGAQNGQALWITNRVNAGKLCPHQDFVANQALHWQFDGKDYLLFGLIDQYQGGVFISRLEMLRLAENLTGVATLPEDQVDPGRLQRVEEAASLAGFAVKAPTQLVAGIQFDHAVYLQGTAASTDRAAGELGQSTEAVNLVYTAAGKPTRSGIDYGLFITQASGALRSLEEIYNWGAFEHVTVNGQPGVYRQMCWDTTAGGMDCRQELYWDENGVGYGLTLNLPGALEKEEFFAIAESMEAPR